MTAVVRFRRIQAVVDRGPTLAAGPPLASPPAGAYDPRKMGRLRLSDEDREQRRLERNRKARERRAEIRREKDAAKAKLARSGVEKSGSPTDEFEPTADMRLVTP